MAKLVDRWTPELEVYDLNPIFSPSSYVKLVDFSLMINDVNSILQQIIFFAFISISVFFKFIFNLSIKSHLKRLLFL